MASYTINEEKEFPFPTARMLTAVQGAAAGLEGKILEQDEQSVRIQFHKTIHGQVLGDRTVFNVALHDADSGTRLAVEAYPVDAVGKPLMFGARKGVTKTVMGWFWAHMDHQLKDEA